MVVLLMALVMEFMCMAAGVVLSCFWQYRLAIKGDRSPPQLAGDEEL
jgi:hypothetical protein